MSAVGRRNVAYVAGTLVLLVLAVVVEQFSHGYDRGAGALAAMIAWTAGSLLSFGVNALLVLRWAIDQVRTGGPMIASPVSRAVIGCILPILILALGLTFIS